VLPSQTLEWLFVQYLRVTYFRATGEYFAVFMTKGEI